MDKKEKKKKRKLRKQGILSLKKAKLSKKKLKKGDKKEKKSFFSEINKGKGKEKKKIKSFFEKNKDEKEPKISTLIKKAKSKTKKETSQNEKPKSYSWAFILILVVLFFGFIVLAYLYLSKWNYGPIIGNQNYIERTDQGYLKVKEMVGKLREDLVKNFGFSINLEETAKPNEIVQARQNSKNLALNLIQTAQKSEKELKNPPQEFHKLNEQIQNYYLQVQTIGEEYQELNALFVELVPQINEFSNSLNTINFNQRLRTIQDVDLAIGKIQENLPKIVAIKEKIALIEANGQTAAQIKELYLNYLGSHENFMNRQIEFLNKKKEHLQSWDKELENEAVELELKISEEMDNAFLEFIEGKNKLDEEILANYDQKLDEIQTIEVEIENLIEEGRTTKEEN